MKIADNLIVKFREKVNSNNEFVYELFHDKDNKNIWNLICSCMDWISVSIRFLSKRTRFHKDIDVRVMQLYSIISAIDIVFESINQLHRAIFNTEQIPYKGVNTIFVNNILNLDDNDYFKELRAMFGAHPVNLKHKDKKKWFASWPYDPFSANNSLFEIRLYSNEVGESDLTFGIDTNELELFLIERYNHLSNLVEEIDNQYIQFCTKLTNLTIQSSDDSLEILHILKKEIKRRLNYNYYSSIIDELIKIFSTSVDNAKLLQEENDY